MRINDVSYEEHPEYFAGFDDSTIRYISDEEFQEIIKKELAKYR